jgi:hypothetical protein
MKNVRTNSTYTLYTRYPIFVARKMGFKQVWAIYLLNFILIGAPLWTGFQVGFSTTVDFAKIGSTLFWFIELAAIWLWLGPLLITWWEQNYFQTIMRIANYRDNGEGFPEKFRRAITTHVRSARWYGFSFIIIALYFFYIASDAVKVFSNVFDEPVFLFLTIAILAISGFSCGYGISGAIQTIRFFSALKNIPLIWRPFHEDTFGGYGFLGQFALITVIGFSAGSIVLPATIGLARLVGTIDVDVIYVIVGLYSLLIMLITILPLLFLNNSAGKQRGLQTAQMAKILHSRYQQLVDNDFVSTKKDDETRYLISLIELQKRVADTPIVPFKFGRLAFIVPIVSASAEHIISLFK